MTQQTPSHRKVLFDFLRFIVARFRQDRCAQMAASLTFTTLLSLVPLITIALTLFSAFPVFADFSTHIKAFALSNLMPETGGKMITRYMQLFAESATRLTTLGILFLAMTAMLMMVTIDNAFNTIWRVTAQRKIVQRLLIYWAVLTLGPILVGGSLTLTSWLVGLSIGYANAIPTFGIVMLKIVPFMLTSLAFSLLFRVVPNRYVSWHHAMIGGGVAAAIFETMNQIFAVYIANFPTYKLVYGAFASVPIFLMWVYLSWFSVLLGALITAALPHWRSHFSLHINPVTRFYCALEMLRQMQAGLRVGRVLTLNELSAHLRIGYDDAEGVLRQLAAKNMVGKLGGQGWAMIRGAEHIAVGELAEIFLWDARKLPDALPSTEVSVWLSHLETVAAEVKGQSVAELWGNKSAHP